MDPLGELITPPDTLKPQLVPWKGKLSSAVRALFVGEEGVEVSGRVGMNEKCYF